MEPSFSTLPVSDGPLYTEEPLEPEAAPRWRDRVDYARWSFYGGMLGGLLILVAAFVAALFITAIDALDRPFLGATWETAMLMGVWGLVCGAAVILAALRVKERPDGAALPGLLMLAAGVLSFFALGGFIVGGLAAIVAGVLAVAGSRSVWRVPAPRLGGRIARAEP